MNIGDFSQSGLAPEETGAGTAKRSDDRLGGEVDGEHATSARPALTPRPAFEWDDELDARGTPHIETSRKDTSCKDISRKDTSNSDTSNGAVQVGVVEVGAEPAPDSTFTFTAEIIEWRGPAPFLFIALPQDAAEAIHAIRADLTYGWGMIPVTAIIGETTWQTSMYARQGTYFLPIKVAVQRAEGLGLGDTPSVRVELR